MPIHRMHLKGPWEFESRSSAVPAGAVTMPIDWRALFGSDSGQAVFRRRFHEPTNLDDDETVWIVFDAVGGRGCVSVNGVTVGHLQTSRKPQRFDMTAHLLPFSELTVELEYAVATDDEPGGLFAPVAIEIESSDDE